MIIFESTFPANYREKEIKAILDLLTTGKFCQIVCIPGAGKATILRLLAHNRDVLKFHLKEKEINTRFFYLNLLELADFSQADIATFILTHLEAKVEGSPDPLALTKKVAESVNKLVTSGQSVFLLFDHFDEYQNKLPRPLFQMLRNLRSIAKYKFAVAFATRRDLVQLVDPEILKDFYDFFVDNCVYLSVYDESAINLLFLQIEKVFAKKLSGADKQKITHLAGGHIKLTKVIAESFLRDNISLDSANLLTTPIVKATLSEIWLTLTAQEQQTTRSIVQNQKVAEDALENLLKFDLLKKQFNLPRRQAGNTTIQPAPTRVERGEQYLFTIPLFKEFVASIPPTIIEEKITFDPNTKDILKGQNLLTDLLSPGEYRLLQYFILNQGKVVTRDEIIKVVWHEAQIAEGITDEAIDQLIYRLRKKTEDDPNNPKHTQTVKGQGFRFQP